MWEARCGTDAMWDRCGTDAMCDRPDVGPTRCGTDVGPTFQSVKPRHKTSLTDWECVPPLPHGGRG
jgi:hypothetical protein